MDLVLIIACSVLLTPLVLFTSGPLRIVLSLAFVLFFPGYSLISALFPAKGRFNGIERVALGFGLSLALVPLIGLGLNFTPWGIRLEPILFSLLIFILAVAGLALYRRSKVMPAERFEVNFGKGISRIRSGWAGQGLWDKVLTIILGVAIVGTVGTVAYAIEKPRAIDKFTEFYILGPGGKAIDYPRDIVLGASGEVIVGIVNHEGEAVTYSVGTFIDSEKIGQADAIILKAEEKWEQKVSFTPTRLGTGQQVEFWLYREGQSDPYRTVHLWIDVTEP